MMAIKRLFIETDILHEDELRHAERVLYLIFKDSETPFSRSFDETCDFAWQEIDKAWAAVLRADEIYGDSSLVPLSGYGTYTGAPVIMNIMMKRAITEGVKGKSLIFLRSFKDIKWDQIDHKLLPKAFKDNKLFTLEETNRYVLAQVDIKNLMKLIKSKL